MGLAAAEAAAKAPAGDVALCTCKPKVVEQVESMTLKDAFAGYLKHRSTGNTPCAPAP